MVALVATLEGIYIAGDVTPGQDVFSHQSRLRFSGEFTVLNNAPLGHYPGGLPCLYQP